VGLVAFPDNVDDDGTLQSGTVWNKEYRDAQLVSIEDWVVSATNPTIKCKTIIDEVKTARGNLASVNARISNVVDADGNPVLPASAVTTATLQQTLGVGECQRHSNTRPGRSRPNRSDKTYRALLLVDYERGCLSEAACE